MSNLVETELYDTLGIPPNANTIEIKKAYRKLALQHHPDKGGDEKVFKKITAAYEVLKDKEKRKAYDQFGKNGLRGSHGIPGDLFSTLFDRTSFGNIFNMFQEMHNVVRREQPVIFRREVTLEELCQRKVISLKVTRNRTCTCQKNTIAEQKCVTCNGAGKIVEHRSLAPGFIQRIERACNSCKGRGVTIPICGNCDNGTVQDPKLFHIHLTPEMENNYQYKFAGEGNESPGVLPGDFIVQIVHKTHEQFTLDKRNLIYKRKTTLREALCGYNSRTLHPSGENIQLQFPGIISPGEQQIIYGKGLDSTGNLYIEHNIIFPKTLTEEQTRVLSTILI